VNAHDHALVIGIQRYRNSPDRFNDLHGPDNDAAAVAEWLRKPDGGALPAQNVHVVRSADLPDPFPNPQSPEPARVSVEDHLRRLIKLPKTAYGGQHAGRRLYVYISGHGFAKKIDQPALITADGYQSDPRNVLFTTWVDWLYTAARFKEFVLWADCCANRVPTVLLYPCPEPEEVALQIDGKRFIAFAAPLNQSAVENRMDDGQWHGVFTYALLQGLKGAAAGAVTSGTLRDYLVANMKSFMAANQRVSAVAQEPVFGTTDAMSFTTPPVKPKYTVTLRFPQSCIGMDATISVNASTPLLAQTNLMQQDWTVDLEAGLYVAHVPDPGISHPFAVAGDRSHADITI
jgi:hypothetical protein